MKSLLLGMFRQFGALNHYPKSPHIAASATPKMEKLFQEYLFKYQNSIVDQEDLEGDVHMVDYVIYEDQSQLFDNGVCTVSDVSKRTVSFIEDLQRYYGPDNVSGISYDIGDEPGLPLRIYDFEEWACQRKKAVSMFAFLHWLEKGNLILDKDIEEKLGADTYRRIGIDVEDYVLGICLMCNKLPSYVIHQVLVGDYDCPKKVLKLLTEIHTLLQSLKPQDNFLRNKFDEINAELNKVEQICSDVNALFLPKKINGMEDDDKKADKHL